MTIIAIDDTDSRTRGMCTTYVGHRIAEELSSEYNAQIERVMLVRLNPAAKHKTRGNAAVAIHTDIDPETGLEVASNFVSKLSADSDDMTNPGVVVSPYNNQPQDVQLFTRKVLTSLREINEAVDLIDDSEYLSYHQGNGRGRIGCVAAIGAWEALNDWTYESISYRIEENRGTKRQVNYDSIFHQADEYYPEAWDTVDRVQNKAICVPTAPGPILYGIRGDNKKSVQTMGYNIRRDEPVESTRVFVTNQGTDAHIIEADSISDISENTSYKVGGTVSKEPETKEGGHVFFKMKDYSEEVQVAAFEPTKHFRDVVRDLRIGDKITVNGEFSNGTLKIEKLAVRDLNRTKMENPDCPDCGLSMSSAGRNQGYRCKECSNHQDSKRKVTVEREIEEGWYEVPPCARRHIAKPLIRGGFDDITYPFN